MKLSLKFPLSLNSAAQRCLCSPSGSPFSVFQATRNQPLFNLLCVSSFKMCYLKKFNSYIFCDVRSKLFFFQQPSVCSNSFCQSDCRGVVHKLHSAADVVCIYMAAVMGVEHVTHWTEHAVPALLTLQKHLWLHLVFWLHLLLTLC